MREQTFFSMQSINIYKLIVRTLEILIRVCAVIAHNIQHIVSILPELTTGGADVTISVKT